MNRAAALEYIRLADISRELTNAGREPTKADQKALGDARRAMDGDQLRWAGRSVRRNQRRGKQT